MTLCYFRLPWIRVGSLPTWITGDNADGFNPDASPG